jgi:predicted RND superfamily exporter protein
MLQKLFRHPWIIITVVLTGTLFFCLQLPKTRIDNDITKFVPERYPSRLAFEEVEETFGSQDHVSIAFHASKGTIFTPGAISYIDRVTRAIEELNYVDEVNSLANADFISGTPEGMEVTPLVEEFAGTDEEIRALENRLISWDVYRKLLFSEDFESAQIIATLNRDLDVEVWEQAYYDIRGIVDDSGDHGLVAYVAGNPVMTALMGTSVRGDLRNLIPFVLVVVFLLLFLSFRNVGGVVLPLVTVSISTIWTLGIMALAGISLSMLATAIPVLLIAVGSAYGIHIISHYYDRRDGASSIKENRRIVFETLHTVGKPVLLAGLTTIAGFGSLAVSSVLPMRRFGIFTALGVLIALVVALTFIPALLLVRPGGFPRRASRPRKRRTGAAFTGILKLYHFVVTKRSLGVLLVLAIILPVSVYGMSRIVIDNSMVEYFRRGAEIRDADDFLRSTFGGTKDFSVVVQGRARGDLTDPEVLKAMDDLSRYLQNHYDEVGKVIGFTDYIRRMNKVMNYTSPVDTESQAALAENGEAGEDEVGSGSGEGSFFTEEFMLEEGIAQGPETAVKTMGSGSEDSTSVSGGSPGFGSSRQEALSHREIGSLMTDVYRDARDLNLKADEYISRVMRELNLDGEVYNEIPYDPAKYPVSSRSELKDLITQYLLLFSGNLDDFADDALEPSQARMHVQLTTTGNHLTKQLSRDIRRFVEERFPEGYQVKIAGHADIEATFTDLIVRSQILSIIAALVIVFLIIALSFRSAAAGFFGILPLSVAIMVIFGFMGFAGFKLDIVTSLVASVAIGIGIDYSIHFLSRYHLERRRTENLNLVTRNALLSTGKAIIINALTVGAGFAVLMFSNFNPIAIAGLLVALTMITTSLAAMTVLPVLLNKLKPRFLTRADSGRRWMRG